MDARPLRWRYKKNGATSDVSTFNITPVNSNSHADMYNGLRALNPSEVAYMQASVERIYDRFTKIVSEGRSMPVADVDAIAQGRVWSGADAINIGLVDEIGTLEDALNYAALSIEGVGSLKDVQIVEYPKPQTMLETLMESFGGGESVFAGTPLESIETAFAGWDATESGKAYARMPFSLSIQ